MARKVWYVVDPDDLQPFARWIKGMGRPTDQQARKAAKKAAKHGRVVITIGKHYREVQHPPGLLPWEDEEPPELIRLVRDIGRHHD
jgi:hypothetical protein